jgi:small redox-active disulfide protein 2
VEIKVLGSCCSKCDDTIALIGQVAKARGVSIEVEKVTDIQRIMGYGVMSTPGVVIDGKVVHAGGMPKREKVEQWLAGTAA